MALRDISKLMGVLERKKLATDIILKRKLEVGYTPKRLAARHGKAVLLGKGKGVLGDLFTDKKKGKTMRMRDAGPRSLLFHVELSELGRTRATLFPALVEDIDNALNLMYKMMYLYINEQKIKYVPVETGALKRSLLRSLTVHKSEIQNGNVTIEMGSNLPYLGIVNKMPTYPTPGVRGHLKHPPYVGKYKFSYKTHEKLHDPEAVGSFMGFITAEARKEAEKVFWAALNKAEIYKNWKGIFGWTRGSQVSQLFKRRRW